MTRTTNTALPNHTCPLCGGPNACTPAQSGKLDAPCWCREASFSAELLAKVPEPLKNKACICAICAARSAD
jgi:Cysteine-rich CWC